MHENKSVGRSQASNKEFLHDLEEPIVFRTNLSLPPLNYEPNLLYNSFKTPADINTPQSLRHKTKRDIRSWQFVFKKWQYEIEHIALQHFIITNILILQSIVTLNLSNNFFFLIQECTQSAQMCDFHYIVAIMKMKIAWANNWMPISGFTDFFLNCSRKNIHKIILHHVVMECSFSVGSFLTEMCWIDIEATVLSVFEGYSIEFKLKRIKRAKPHGRPICFTIIQLIVSTQSTSMHIPFCFQSSKKVSFTQTKILFFVCKNLLIC